MERRSRPSSPHPHGSRQGRVSHTRLLHRQPCSPSRCVPLPQTVLQGALWDDGPQNYAESSPEAKRVLCITVLPCCLTAVQQPILECSRAKTWLEGSEDGVSPQISACQPSKLCTALSTFQCASVARGCVSKRFPGHRQVSRAARVAHSPPEVGDESHVASFQLAGSSFPRTFLAPGLSQKQMPRVCRRPGAPVPAVGAIGTRTPRVPTMGRGGAAAGGIHSQRG